ncbi:MAG: GTP cyclohydrolase I FolE, partial [Pseudomonadota bacterium]
MDIKTLEEMMARGESHAGNLNTPIRQDAFELTNEEKIELIAKNFRQIMLTLGLDLEDDSLKGTPMRVAKMYVEEIFSGLNPANLPKATLFENKYDYRQMLVEKNITVHSMCEHHFVPIVGYAHVAYISSGQVIGLSKINRIVRHFGRRPQVQERLTREIANHLRQVLNTEDVAVVIDAKHYCVAMRGIEDQASTTITAEY